MRSHRTRQGFTLVEIIVVVAILAALAAIMFPVFARARESARRSACTSNLHQIGIALALYRADYDGVDPEKGVRLSHSALGLPYPSSMDVIYHDYIRNRGVVFCPSGDPPRPTLGSNYWWGAIDCEYTDPSIDWEGAAAARGPDYPLVVCGNHNGPPHTRSSLRSTDVLVYYVLRIDGRVDPKKTTVADEKGGPFWW